MKKLIYPAFFLAIAVVAAGCSSQKEEFKGQDEEIRLHSNISAIETKAAPGESLTGITLLRYDAASESAINYATPKVISNASLTGNSIEFPNNGKEYYGETDNAYFIGYYPSPATASTDNTATLTIDGNTDIMATNLFDAGTRLSPLTGEMTFAHLLSQLDVKIMAATAEDIAYFGEIKSISITDQPTSGTLTCTSTPQFVTAGGTGEFTVAASGTLTTSATTCGTVMIAPVQGTLNAESTNYETDIKLKIETANVPSQTVSVTLKSVSASTYALPQGKKSTVTLTFKKKEISASGAIAEWGADGSTGGQEIN